MSVSYQAHLEAKVNQEWCEWLNQLAPRARQAVFADEIRYFEMFVCGTPKYMILNDALAPTWNDADVLA